MRAWGSRGVHQDPYSLVQCVRGVEGMLLPAKAATLLLVKGVTASSGKPCGCVDAGHCLGSSDWLLLGSGMPSSSAIVCRSSEEVAC